MVDALRSMYTSIYQNSIAGTPPPKVVNDFFTFDFCALRCGQIGRVQRESKLILCFYAAIIGSLR